MNNIKAADRRSAALSYIQLSKIIKPGLELFEGDFAVIAFLSFCTGGFTELFEFFLSDELCSLAGIHTAVSCDICFMDCIVFMDNIKGFKCADFATRLCFAWHNSFAVFAVDTTTWDKVFTAALTRLKLNLIYKHKHYIKTNYVVDCF